jgi:hypothetical protein
MVEQFATKSSDRNRATKDDHLGPSVVLPIGAFPILESLCPPNSTDREKAALIERLLRQGLTQGRETESALSFFDSEQYTAISNVRANLRFPEAGPQTAFERSLRVNRIEPRCSKVTYGLQTAQI